ncbi:hypothetical protein MXB_2448 [Myxobolus squamalis]|nr:hypothetical protein MXB_2448 [Myxobolus squamalis]
MDEKEESFQYLISNGIGFTNSILYITYAYFCEMSHQLSRADQVYNLGIARRSQPAHDLTHAYRNPANKNDQINNWNHPLIKSHSDRDNIMIATSWGGAKHPSQRPLCIGNDGITIQGVFHDENCIVLSKNRCYLSFSSSMPIPNDDGPKAPWIVATETENKNSADEFSIEELMSLRYYHLKFNQITHPLKYQLVNRFHNVPSRLKMFIEF